MSAFGRRASAAEPIRRRREAAGSGRYGSACLRTDRGPNRARRFAGCGYVGSAGL